MSGNEVPQNARPYLFHLSEQRGYLQGWSHYAAAIDNRILCHSFHGVPYALPPVDARRWTKPKPLDPCFRYGTRASPAQCQQASSVCPQTGVKNSSSLDEDCLQLNIWMPAGPPPHGGFPVLFFIHGGFLQVGSPNSINCRDLLGHAGLRCIVICPAYRVGVLGFLAANEFREENHSQDMASGNWGFWDQRLALEWTYKNASYLGGNASSITIGGYSAGAHSAFHQLLYDLFKAKTQIIKRVLMLANSPGPQPKTVQETQVQFDDLLATLNIPREYSPQQKLAFLRSIPLQSLLEAVNDPLKFPLHEFRGCSDGAFVPTGMYQLIDGGHLSEKMKRAGIELLIGENSAERHVYSKWRPPKENTRGAVQRRLSSDYSSPLVATLFDQMYSPKGQLPKADPLRDSISPNWTEAFGTIYADLQVHALQRGLVNALARGGAGHLVRRYRIDWRAQCSRHLVPMELGPTHMADMVIWFYGMVVGDGLTAKEKVVVERWLHPVFAWLEGDAMKAPRDAWAGPHGDVRFVRRLRRDGLIDTWQDEDWERGLRVWKYAAQAGKPDSFKSKAKL